MGSTVYTPTNRAAWRILVADQTTNPVSADELKITDTTTVKWDTTGVSTIHADVKDASPSGKFLRDDGTWQALTDPWTYLNRAGIDFTTSSATAVDVGSLAFTPAASKRYEFEAILMVKTVTATVNPRVGLAWPTGLNNGVAIIEEVQTAAGALVYAAGNQAAALLTPVGGLPDTAVWPVFIRGMLDVGASPSGSLKIQLASETAGTNVTVLGYSFLKFRQI